MQTVKNVILQMGAIHTRIFAICYPYWKKFQDSGLKDVITEAGIVAEGSVAGVMEGCHYNRAVRTYKCMCKALFHIVFKEFISRMKQNHSPRVGCTEKGLEIIHELHENLYTETYEKTTANAQLDGLLHYSAPYMDFLRHDNGVLSEF